MPIGCDSLFIRILPFCLNVLLLFFLQETTILILSSTSTCVTLQALYVTRLQSGPKSTLSFHFYVSYASIKEDHAGFVKPNFPT